ncbi:MAG: prolyl oligopeptidase family serine peptidase [Chloroherpetonaceae bacterium]|nr:prolyl oligopeptidase family serine peptidase [Chthonomonadaceae bacterium]MDW8207753.1 prolyl oligopeptidase family serine peptidase [Chloroherpetonaceae bacterium]
MRRAGKRAGILLVVVALSGEAWPQGSQADYERARTVRQWMTGKVIRVPVRPQWIHGTCRFWYRRDLPDGRREFLFVDPDVPVRRPAFDHVRMAAALSRALQRNVTAERLPIDAIAYPGGPEHALRIQVGARTFLCALDTYALTPVEEPIVSARVLPLTRPLASRRTGPETHLTFVNRMAQTVTLFWVDTEGRRQSYGTLAPGQSREQHTYAGHVWVIVGEDNRPLIAFEAGDNPTVAVIDVTENSAALTQQPARRTGADTSPDGRWRVLVRGYNLILRDLRADTEVPLTQDGSAQDRYEGPILWSPDATKFVAMRTVPAQERKIYLIESSPKDQVQPRLHAIDYLKPGDRIARVRPVLFDVASRRAVPISDALFPNPWSLSEFAWDADSKRFTFLYNQRGHQVMRLIEVDAATGAARPLIEEQAKTFIDWTNKVYLYRIGATREALWMSERDGWNHLYLYDLATGTLRNQITRGEWVVRGVDRVDEARRQIWFRAGGIRPGQDPYHVHYCRVNFDGTGLTVLTEGDGTHAAVFSPDGRYLVDTYSRVDLPPVSEVRRADTGGRVLVLERGDARALLATGWRYPERFVAKGRDGRTDIYGVIVRPSRFDPTRKYPVIEYIYAGPQGAAVPKEFLATMELQAMAELGFIVVQIDGMGTNFRSKAFHDVCWQNLGDAGFPDRIRWIRAAAQKYPYMDLTRVGIYGTSAGGQNALGGLLQHGDFYKVGVADCGCHDNRMDKIWWNEQWMGWPVGPHYAQQSNVTLAPKLQGRLLLMVGEMDTNVDPASTLQVVNALIHADKDFELLVMPGVGHGVLGTPYGRRRMQDFFVRHLLGVEPRWTGRATPTAPPRAGAAGRSNNGRTRPPG